MQKLYKALKERALQSGANKAVIIETSQIVFDPRSFLKCRFGCKRWGNYWTCPPNLSLSQEQFLEAFNCYQYAIIIQASDPLLSQQVSLEVEKQAMLTWNCHYAFALVLCVQCEECAYPEPCRYPHLARPAMDAFGVDIGKTAQNVSLEVEFDKDGQLLPCWYSMVLIQ